MVFTSSARPPEPGTSLPFRVVLGSVARERSTRSHLALTEVDSPLGKPPIRLRISAPRPTAPVVRDGACGAEMLGCVLSQASTPRIPSIGATVRQRDDRIIVDASDRRIAALS